MNHTPTPWKFAFPSRHIYAVDTGRHIATIHVRALPTFKDEEEAKANARFIVQACNSYEAMREALEGLIELYEKPYIWKTNNQSAYKKAKEALALVEGKESNP